MSISSHTRQAVCFPDACKPFHDIIDEMIVDDASDKNKVWKIRFSAYSLKDRQVRFWFEDDVCYTSRLVAFEEWLKLLGDVKVAGNLYTVGAMEIVVEFENDMYAISFKGGSHKLRGQLKNVLKKAAFCVGCRHCEANCLCGGITFVNRLVKVNHCAHCGACVSASHRNGNRKACLRYESLKYNREWDLGGKPAPKVKK